MKKDETIKKIYDLVCIEGSGTKKKLKQYMKIHVNKKHHGLPDWKSSYLLTKSKDFVKFWVDQREFCKKDQNKDLPYQRALDQFMSTKFSKQTHKLINELNKMTKTPGKPHGFFTTLARYSVGSHADRCPCENIFRSLKSGKTPAGDRLIIDGKKLSEKVRLGYLNKYLGAEDQMCLKHYGPSCHSMTAAEKALEIKKFEALRAAKAAARKKHVNIMIIKLKVAKKERNMERNITNMERNTINMERNITNMERNTINMERNIMVTNMERNTINMERNIMVTNTDINMHMVINMNTITTNTDTNMNITTNTDTNMNITTNMVINMNTIDLNITEKNTNMK